MKVLLVTALLVVGARNANSQSTPRSRAPTKSEAESTPSTASTTVVFTDGTQLAVEKYEVRESVVVLQRLDGKLQSVPRSAVDLEATERASQLTSHVQSDTSNDSQVDDELKCDQLDIDVVADGNDEEYPYAAYACKMLTAIQKQWERVRVSRSATVVVRFVVWSDGTVTDAEITRSAGAGILDQRALRAVRRANPLPRLPADYPRSSVTVHLRFAYSNEE